MVLKNFVKDNIRKLIDETFKNVIFVETRNIEDAKKAYPFHAIFFGDKDFIYGLRERSIVTKLGQTFYPKLAKIIAENRYKEVYREHEISGMIDKVRIEKIEKIVSELRGIRKKEGYRKRKPNIYEEMREIFSVKSKEKQFVSTTADLFVEDYKDGPLFFEIKSPKPNLDVCAESKKKFLVFRTIYANKNPQAYLALYYNPEIERNKYKHSFTKQILDFDREVLLGKEMWDILGGEGAWEEMLDVIKEQSKKNWENKDKFL